MAVDAKGNIFVADTGAARIVVFSTGGGYIRSWGAPGVGPGSFTQPVSVIVQGNGRVLVLDAATALVQEFTPAGRLLSVWGGSGSGQGQLPGPAGPDAAASRAWSAWWTRATTACRPSSLGRLRWRAPT